MDKAREIVAANGLSDVVTLVKAKVEDLPSLADVSGGFGEVDVIVSEWMGVGLVHERMLEVVLRGAKPQGLWFHFPDPPYKTISCCQGGNKLQWGGA